MAPNVALMVCISEQIMRYNRTGPKYGKTAYCDVVNNDGSIAFQGSNRGRSNRMVEDAALVGRRTLLTYKGRDGLWTRPAVGTVRRLSAPPAGGDPTLAWFLFVPTKPLDARMEAFLEKHGASARLDIFTCGLSRIYDVRHALWLAAREDICDRIGVFCGAEWGDAVIVLRANCV